MIKSQDRFKTILVMVVGFIAISWIFNLPLLSKIALGIGIASILSSFAARWIEWIWLQIAKALGWVNSRVLLTIVYFIFLFPIALLSRFFTKDPLKLKAKQAESLYTTRDHQYTKEDLENVF